MDKELANLKKRIEKNGIAYTKPSVITRKIAKKNSDIVVFKNRRLGKSVAICDKKLKELLGIDLL